MKKIYTIFFRQIAEFKAIPAIALFFSILILYSCTSTAQEDITNKTESNGLDTNQQVFTFHKDKNGIDNTWKAVFKDGKLSELYKNGKKIPDEYMEDYTDMVDEEIDGLQGGPHDFGGNSYRFNIDMRNFDSTMSCLGENLGKMNFGISDSIFNSEDFHKSMDSLKTNLKKLRNLKFAFHYDTAAFNKSMKQLKKSLKHMKFNAPMFYCKNGFPVCRMEAFKEGMKNFDYEMRHNRIFKEGLNIDMSQFEENMKDFDTDMKNFDFNMKDFDKNMKKLDGFLKELKHELVNDNLIKNENDDFSMKFNKDELIINGKKVPGELLKKYKAIYKKHFGKEIDDEFNINNNSKDDQGINDN